MIRERLKVLELIGNLLSYPKTGYSNYAVVLHEIFQKDKNRLAKEFSKFSEYIQSKNLHEQEELFTRTFEINPGCALEVGWHLFGEEYSRGLFMVRMREELRRNNIPESSELPDHIFYVLPILDRMNMKDGREFAKACVCPSLGKMMTALEKIESPYLPLVKGLTFYLLKEYDLSEDCLTPLESNCYEEGEDPLKNYQGEHASAIPGHSGKTDEGFSCGDCSAELIPLDMKFQKIHPGNSQLNYRSDSNG